MGIFRNLVRRASLRAVLREGATHVDARQKREDDDVDVFGVGCQFVAAFEVQKGGAGVFIDLNFKGRLIGRVVYQTFVFDSQSRHNEIKTNNNDSSNYLDSSAFGLQTKKYIMALSLPATVNKINDI